MGVDKVWIFFTIMNETKAGSGVELLPNDRVVTLKEAITAKVPSEFDGCDAAKLTLKVGDPSNPDDGAAELNKRDSIQTVLDKCKDGKDVLVYIPQGK